MLDARLMEVLQVFNSMCDLYTIKMLLYDITNETDTIRERLEMTIDNEGKELMILELFSKHLLNYSPLCLRCENEMMRMNENHRLNEIKDDGQSEDEECPLK